MVKISAQSKHFSVLVLKVSHSKFWLFKPIFRHLDPDSEYGSRSRSKLNVDPSRSKTLVLAWYFAGKSSFYEEFA